MQRKLLLNFFLLLLCLVVGVNSAWGDESFTTSFTSGISSTPYSGTNINLWNISKSGTTGYEGTRGIQFQGGASGTFETKSSYLNISSVVVAVAKSSKGSGTVKIYVNDVLKKTISSFSTTKTDETLSLATPLSGKIKVVVDASSNSLYIKSISVTYDPTIAITSISVDETANVGVGGTVTLIPTVLPANHTEVVDWESDAAGVATVSSTGVVTGVAAGEAHITAKAHDNPSTIYDVCTVTVTAADPVTGVSLDQTSKALNVGDEFDLTATVAPSNATNKNVTWTSSDDTKATVSNGHVTALAAGTPTITVTTTDGSFTATCDLTITNVAVTGVTLDKTSASCKVGQTVQLTPTIAPANATIKTVSWNSNDEDVATVDENGLVTAVAAGTATITVTTTDGSKTATCTVTVTDGSIDLDATGEIEITSFPSFSGSGYKTADPYTIGDYDWVATNCMLGDGKLQLRKDDGVLTSPTIKCGKGFTVTVTVPTNSVTVSDGTSSASTSAGSATLTTTKTSTTITISAGGSYAQVSKITITPNKEPIATSVSITDPGTLAKGATGTFSASSTDADDCTKAWSSSDDDVITVNASTGAYEAIGRGTATITYTITPDDATTYRSVSAELEVSVTAPVEVSASDVAMTYGDAAKAIGATTSAGYAGTLTYASGNTNIATVDASGKVTAVAAGTTTITISAPADAEHLYTAGDDKVINVTVSAPTGGTTAADFTQSADVYETLLSNTKKSGWTYTEWTSSSSYGACSTAGTAGQLITDNYVIPAKANPCIFFEHTGNNSFDNPSAACKLYVQEGSNTPIELTIPTYFTGSDWTYVESGDIDISDYIGKTVHFIFDYSPSTGNNGKWEVKNFGIYYDSFGVKLNASGYATYCSEYPLDFSDYATADYSAWQITAVTSTTITFSQITGAIKGGQGILLKGNANATITLTSADGSTVLGDNKLEGTLAPKNIAANTYYGLSGNKFVKVGAGNVPAGKALLPASAIPASARELTFLFEDDQTTGISLTPALSEGEGAVYNLQGQRVNANHKGLVIKNGKKVFVK